VHLERAYARLARHHPRVQQGLKQYSSQGSPYMDASFRPIQAAVGELPPCRVRLGKRHATCLEFLLPRRGESILLARASLLDVEPTTSEECVEQLHANNTSKMIITAPPLPKGRIVAHLTCRL